MSLRIPALALLLILAGLPISLAFAKNSKSADSARLNVPCIDGRTAPAVGFWTWPANTEVNIYLRQPDFSPSDVPFVRTAVENWDQALKQNGSNVRFIFNGLTTETKMAQGEMTIVRQVVSDKNERQRAVLEAHSRQRDKFIDYALLLVDPAVKNPSILTNVLAHELGHSLGLMDCYKCDSHSTAMGMLKSSDESNGIDGPTSCDKTKVSTAYAALRPRGNSTASSSAAVAQNKPVEDSPASRR